MSLRLVVVAGLMLVAVAVITILSHKTQSLGPAITGSHYRLYETSNSVSPGTPLAATSTAGQLSSQGQSFRLRTGLTARDNTINVTAIQAGVAASCIVVSGIPYCSGRATNGELGNNTRTSTNGFTPVDTSTGLAGKTITSFMINALNNNYVTVCAIADGSMYCWGSNFYGILGINQTNTAVVDSIVPVQAIMTGSLTGETVVKADGGSGHACGVTASHKGFCWGTNGSGRVGDGTSTARRQPTELYMSGVLSGKSITDIGAGSGHSCGIASGAAYCWGYGVDGNLGDGNSTSSAFPVAVSTAGVMNGKTLTAIAVALNTSCAIDTAGAAYCWGQNNATLGNNTGTGDSNVPVAVDMTLVPAGGFSKITGREGNFCGIATADSLPYCWGTNSSGGTGRGTAASATARPTAATATGFLSGKTVKTLTAGRSSYCGITNLDEPFCWGSNANGNLGMNSATSSYLTATAVPTTNFTPAQGVTVAANTIGARLEFAMKTAGSCSAQTGFAPVTTTSDIAWSVNGSVNTGTAITATGNDPVSGSTTTLETYVSDSSLNNPQAIIPGNTGLWDFSLKDNSGMFDTAYCLRLAQSNGTAYTAYTAYPEIKTAQGVLSVDIVDVGGTTVPSPSVAIPSLTVATACQSVTGTLGTSTQKIRVGNDTNNPSWTLSLAATGGATSYWQHTTGPYSYDFNDNSGSPAGCTSGLDGDGLAGQLVVNPSAGSSVLDPEGACSNFGISKGSQQGFVQGTTNVITLLSAGAATSLQCKWDLTGVGLTQSIPSAQPAGTYTLDMTLTVLAQ